MYSYSNEISWIALRLAYAWVYLYPVTGLRKNWPGTVAATIHYLFFTAGHRSLEPNSRINPISERKIYFIEETQHG